MIEVRDSVAKDVRELVKDIPEEEYLEISRMGFPDPGKAIYWTYRRALIKKTVLLDDRVAGMFGVCATPLSVYGRPYLMISNEAKKVSPIRFARLYKSEVQKMIQLFPVLETLVDATYLSSCRLLILAGFTLKGPIILNNNLFYKAVLES